MSTYDVIIRNGQVVNSDSKFQADIAIKGGKIQRVSVDQPLEGTADKEIDAKGLHIMPGVIDTHVHFNEPGRAEWEGLATGSRSLAAGGATAFFDMPLNSTPPVINKENLQAKSNLADQKSVVNPYYWGGLVPENIAELKDLHENGVIGFKAFMSPSGIDDFNNADDETLYKGMTEIASFDSILAVHAESTVICDQLAKEKISQGKTSARDFVESRPIISEIEAVRRIISYAEATGCKLHVVHASSRKVTDLINEAKNKGVNASVETCAHYLALTVKDLEKKGGLAKCAPPLRDSDEVEELWVALANGEIDMIASDHSPAPASMKTVTDNYFEGWGGISGAQSTLNVLLTEGYHKRNLPLEKIVEVTAVNPAKRFGVENKGTIAEGYDADITLVNLEESFELKAEDLFYRHQHSPYVGKTFKGNVKTTIVNGNVVYDNGKIITDEN
ncbi:allantoinase [Ornithinibacillus halophilus]|uniref:Allantoinase n=1 Tax=Ornithinibacillus halophilus TaxID=930117 RepID=A0A1M5MQX8_9BACI|nr:allantoinase [Ornithinibacillus halophilus]SHG79708.1 allantoinase [Ornithinibacillus halophilus]